MRHLPTEILAQKDFAQSEGKADREQTRWRSEGIRTSGVARSLFQRKRARVLEKVRVEIRYRPPENGFAFSSARLSSSNLEFRCRENASGLTNSERELRSPASSLQNLGWCPFIFPSRSAASRCRRRSALLQ